MIKLSEFAKKRGVSYMTAWRWWKQGLIKGERLGKSVYVEEDNGLSLVSIDYLVKNLARVYGVSVSTARAIYDRGFSDGVKFAKGGKQ